MFEYVECLMEGLKKIGGKEIHAPRRGRLEVGDSCKFIVLLFPNTSLNSSQ